MSTYTGQRGRKPLTSEQKAAKSLAASAGAPMQAPTYLPDAPDELNAVALAEWSRIGEYLRRTDRIAAVDFQALSYYCSSFALYCEALHQLLVADQPLWVWSNRRPKASLYSEMAVKSAKQTLWMARKFGMTARTRHLDHRRTGRPALPDEIHHLRGSKRKHPRRRVGLYREVDFPVEFVSPPEWFRSCGAIREWDRLVEQLVVLDLWTPLDVAPAVVASASFALILKAMEQYEAEGPAIPIDDDGLQVANPVMNIRSQHFEICEQVWEDYGMNPYDRLQFNRVDGEPDEGGAPKFELFPKDVG